MSEVPKEIFEAAERVRLWAETQGYKYWQVGGVCDRRYAYDSDKRKQDHLSALVAENERWERYMRLS